MKIMLPVDGSEPALDAVRFALRLAREGLACQFVLCNVQEPLHLYEMVLAHDADLVKRASAGAGAHALEAAERLLRATGLPVESEVVTGDPAHKLVERVERHGCDAVIMSARGAGALRQALVGSVSQSVLHLSPVPVVIVKPPPDPEAEPDELAEAARDAGSTSPG